jgi:hypothetical protein
MYFEKFPILFLEILFSQSGNVFQSRRNLSVNVVVNLLLVSLSD